MMSAPQFSSKMLKNLKEQGFCTKVLLVQRQLSKVFLNILKNSYESLNKNAKFISVKVSDGKGFIDIYIEDNGDGFPENRDKLFEPYITNKIDGTGLGLAICKKIIEDHGGEIYLLNSNDFGGASVRIKLYKV